MNDPHFFGYGSLVNTATHIYPNAQKAALTGWRRAWICTDEREVVFLSAVPATAQDQIQGLIASVPNADWVALDKRETGYERVPSKDKVNHAGTAIADIAHYAVAQENWRTSQDHAILLSYLDVVVQGYLQQFGEEGVQAFFDTTDGWDTPIVNDRDTPRYPRAQVLTEQERALVDQHLARIAAQIKS
jgi:hypothetical protein